MSLAIGVVGIAVALPGALATLHLSTLVLASLLYRDPHPDEVAPIRFLVVIPARNEESVIGEALRSVERHRRPRDIVLVVADRCEDRTAEIARGFGARVLERPADAEPGRAAAISDGVADAKDLEWDAVVFIDADAVIEGGFFEAIERTFATGALVAQARSQSSPGPGMLAKVGEAASALGGVATQRGRDRMRSWVRLYGCGMVLRRDIAETRRFRARGASEDGQFNLDLCLDGITARHVDGARLHFASPPDLGAASEQRLRYETGRLISGRRYLGRLLRARTWPAFDAALHVATPPVAFALLQLLLGGVLTALAGWWLLTWIIVAFVVMLCIDEIVALSSSEVALTTWFALLAVPLYVCWKGWIQLRALVGVGKANRPYEPTRRA
jgi:glycosyltransferase involved in cell wall biosynthesis